MKDKDYSLVTGLKMFAVVVIFFLLMNFLNLEHITELRFFNIVIVAFFSNNLARKYVQDNDKVDYIKGLRSIFTANFINVILSILALILYIVFYDPSFVDTFKNGVLLAGELTTFKIASGLFLEGMAGAVIISFMTMQYWKGVVRKTKSIHLDRS